MSFMIDDILGNKTKRRCTTQQTEVTCSPEVTVTKPAEENEEDKENELPAAPERKVPKRPSSPTPSSGSSDSESEPKRKKARTSFTNEQIQCLERFYVSQRYLASNCRTDLARMLNLTENQIKTWFQNRRMKEKRQIRGVEERLGGTVSSPPSLAYPAGMDYLRFSPASSALFTGGVRPLPTPATSALGPVPGAGTPSVPLPTPGPSAFSPASRAGTPAATIPTKGSSAFSPVSPAGTSSATVSTAGASAFRPVSRTGTSSARVPTPGTSAFIHIPQVLTDVNSLHSRINPFISSPLTGLGATGHYSRPLGGLPGMDYPIDAATANMLASSPYAHHLMGPTTL